MTLLHPHREVETEPPEPPEPDGIGSSATPHIVALLAQVDRLRTVPGVAFSPRFERVRGALHALTVLEATLTTGPLDTVVAATGRNAAPPAAYPPVLAALSDAQQNAASTVQHVLLGELHAEVARTAAANHAAVARAFDALVATLIVVAAGVDLRATAPDQAEWSADQREARRATEQTARLLDEHAALLVLAARLAGEDPGHGSHRPGTPTDEWLQLTVATRGWQPHLVWEAWDAPVDNLAGVWGWMLLAGFEVRATQLADIRPYPRPSAADRDQDCSGAPLRSPISLRRAALLLASGCLALGVAVGGSAFAVGFFVAALIEPRDVLAAAREAFVGMLLLSAGVTSGLTWATVAAVGYDLGSIELVPEPRASAPERAVGGKPAVAPRPSRVGRVLSGLRARGRYVLLMTK